MINKCDILKNNEELQSSLRTKKQSPIQEYISERIYKEKSPLCRLPFPYVIEQEEQKTKDVIKQKRNKSKKPKRLFLQYSMHKSSNPFRPLINYEKTPLNEYLSYELSQEINEGLKEVKVLADQIKQIKEEKKKETKEGLDKKQNKKIRIRRTNFKSQRELKGFKASSSATFLR